MALVNMAYCITLPAKRGSDLRGSKFFLNITPFSTAFHYRTDRWVGKSKQAQENYLYVLCNFSDLPAPLLKEPKSVSNDTSRNGLRKILTCSLQTIAESSCSWDVKIHWHICVFVFRSDGFCVIFWVFLLPCSHRLWADRVVPVVRVQHLLWQGPHDQDQDD